VPRDTLLVNVVTALLLASQNCYFLLFSLLLHVSSLKTMGGRRGRGALKTAGGGGPRSLKTAGRGGLRSLITWVERRAEEPQNMGGGRVPGLYPAPGPLYPAQSFLRVIPVSG